VECRCIVLWLTPKCLLRWRIKGVLYYQNSIYFQLQGGYDPLTRGSAPGPRWGLRPPPFRRNRRHWFRLLWYLSYLYVEPLHRYEVKIRSKYIAPINYDTFTHESESNSGLYFPFQQSCGNWRTAQGCAVMFTVKVVNILKWCKIHAVTTGH